MGMTDEERTYQQGLKTAREKFELAGRQPRERKPIVDALPWSPDFGPHICPRCNGAGWLVSRDERNYGEMRPCENCDKANTQMIARCWKVSSMHITDAAPPRLNTFEPYTPEAEQVLAAMKAFIARPFGWLTLYGGTGTGKSHALEAIARYLLTTKVATVYITSTHLWEYLGGVARGEHEDVDYGERFRWLSEVPGLVVDELNLEKSTDFVFRTRRSLLDARYRSGLNSQAVTVIASNDAPDRWQDAAVADRALDTRFVAVFSGTKSYRQVKREQEE
jgi:DNA replication protein DnaC